VFKERQAKPIVHVTTESTAMDSTSVKDQEGATGERKTGDLKPPRLRWGPTPPRT